MAVLVGGRGRRFGGDKLSAALGTRPLLSHTLDAVSPLGPPLLVGTPATLPPGHGHALLPDAVPAPGRPDTGPAPRDGGRAAGGRAPGDHGAQGPLAGIVAALEAARTPLVAVVAGDMPRASAALLRHLAGRWRGEPAVVPVSQAGPQPLHAVYATAAAPQVRAAFNGGERSPLSLLGRLGARFVPVDDSWGAWDRDVDTPEDLQAAHRQTRSDPSGPLGLAPGREPGRRSGQD